MNGTSAANGSHHFTSLEDIAKHHATLYRTFRSGLCRPLAFRRQQLLQLARMCQDNADALADAVFADLGKPKLEFNAFELGGLVERALLCAQNLEAWSAPERVDEDIPDWQKAWQPTVHKQPKGPVLVIAPWNYPLILSLQAVYAAISAGCPALIKPSELVPHFSQLLSELVSKYLDQRAYIVVQGAVAETTRLLELRWAHIFYTGNGRVGRIIARAAAEHLTPVSLELGGKSPVIVDPEYDLNIVARRILFGKAANAGQTCVAPDYILIPRHAQAALVEKLREVIEERFPAAQGGPIGSDSYGRIVNAAHFARLRELLERTKGKVVVGGELDEKKAKIALTVVTDVDGDDSLMDDELFGPILPIVPVDDLQAAIDFVNERDHPLAFYAFTDNAEFKQKVREETLSGGLHFNDTFDFLAVTTLPFSGVGESGYGYQIMKYGFEGFTHRRSTVDVPKEMEPHLANRYAPYTPEKLEFMSALSRLPIPSS